MLGYVFGGLGNNSVLIATEIDTRKLESLPLLFTPHFLDVSNGRSDEKPYTYISSAWSS